MLLKRDPHKLINTNTYKLQKSFEVASKMIEQIVIPSVKVIKEVFAPIVGLPCWRVKRIAGSVISFKFGLVAQGPQPSVYDLRRAARDPSRNLPVRILPADGEWNLSLLDGNWEISTDRAGAKSATLSNAEIENAINVLNGQTVDQVDWLVGSKLMIAFSERGQIYAGIDATIEPDRMAWWLLQTDGAQASFDGHGLLTLGQREA